MRGGDFIPGELINAVDKNEITLKAMKESLDLGKDRKRWLIFSAGVDHANHIAEILTDLGITCRSVHSKMPDSERDANLIWFKEKSNDIRALSNNSVLTTGFDHPAIDFILDLGPTASPVRHVQKYGRGTRPDYILGFDLTTQEGRLAAITNSSKQNCLVADFGGNTRRNGPINDPRIPAKKGKGMGEAPIKECDVCHTLNHAAARICIFCGKEFKFETKIKEVASSAALLVDTTAPIVEIFQVDHIIYSPHQKVGAPLSFKVTYQCGYQNFYEWVCLEHKNYASVKAREWWKKRTAMPTPETTNLALEEVADLPQPTHLRIWANKKPFAEIIASCFDGSGFGTIQVSETYEPPTVDVQANINRTRALSNANVGKFGGIPNVVFDDDDIPF